MWGGRPSRGVCGLGLGRVRDGASSACSAGTRCCRCTERSLGGLVDTNGMMGGVPDGQKGDGDDDAVAGLMRAVGGFGAGDAADGGCGRRGSG